MDPKIEKKAKKVIRENLRNIQGGRTHSKHLQFMMLYHSTRHQTEILRPTINEQKFPGFEPSDK